MTTAARPPMKLSQELIAILAVGVTLTGLQITLFVNLRGEMSELRGEMGSMETRLRGEIGVVRDEMRGEMSVLRDEMRREMNVLREDVRHDIDALRLDIQDIRGDVRQLRDKLLLPAAGA